MRDVELYAQILGIHSVGVPWAEEKSRFTILFERLVIDLLHDALISVVAEWTGLSWSQVNGCSR